MNQNTTEADHSGPYIDSDGSDNPPSAEREYLNQNTTQTIVSPEENLSRSIRRRIGLIVTSLTELLLELSLLYLWIYKELADDQLAYGVGMIRLFFCFTSLCLPVPTDAPIVRQLSFCSDISGAGLFICWGCLVDPMSRIIVSVSFLGLQLMISFIQNCSCQSLSDFEIICRSLNGVAAVPIFLQHMSIALKLTGYSLINWSQAFWCYFIWMLMMLAVGTLLALFVVINLGHILNIFMGQVDADRSLRNWLIVIMLGVIVCFGFGISAFSFLFDLSIYLDDPTDRSFRQTWLLVLNVLLASAVFFALFFRNSLE